MPVYYNSQSIIPAPFVNISRTYSKSGDGTTLGQVYSIILTGTLVAGRGGLSPTDTDTSDATVLASGQLHLTDLLNRRTALESLFSVEGKTLEIQGFDGSAGTKFNPRILNIQFDDGLWNTTVPYTISMEADDVQSSGQAFNNYISSASETWELAHGELDITYSVSHNLTAQGKLHYEPDGSTSGTAYGYAKRWVYERLVPTGTLISATGNTNIDNWSGVPFLSSGTLQWSAGLTFNYSSGVWVSGAGLTNTQFYNHIRQESADKTNGVCSVNETWLVSKEKSIEDYTANVNYSNETGLTSVTVEGSINGLEVRDPVTHNLLVPKWENAASYYAALKAIDPTTISPPIRTVGLPYLISRVEKTLLPSGSPSNAFLNEKALSTTEGYNALRGVINYSFNYDNRMNNWVSGSLIENIQIVDVGQNQVVGIIPVIGRAKGPILQAINTSDAMSRTLSISCVVPKTLASAPSGINAIGDVIKNKPDVSNIVSQVIPSGTSGKNRYFMTQNQEDWNPRTGAYQKNVAWVYEEREV